ncbi:baculoviral IAP repeat-containing protein 6-like [Leptidea sinapis]|uniref:baculoviral IAP repeat-containing protein 6-like n=1 Tax=Leptidea sinapis TaxID=189913 RepID=UPI0021C3D275|nr:baculoviral IAP repeat-containing protein 6-like [Leptidea sinapis]
MSKKNIFGKMTYSQRFSTSSNSDLSEEDEGLASLIADIQATSALMCRSENESDNVGLARSIYGASREARYIELMRTMQFETFEMISEDGEGGFKFTVPYHFEGTVRAAGQRSHPARMKRLAQEAATLATSLPLSYSSSVFVRTDTDRLDIMKVLVSIQSLILVPEPYFNEPGYERSRGTCVGTLASLEYNSNIYQACVRWAMLDQLRSPEPCFREVIQTHFWIKRNEIMQTVANWITDLEGQSGDERTHRTINHNLCALKRHYVKLKEELAKLPVPAGLEDLDEPFKLPAAPGPAPLPRLPAAAALLAPSPPASPPPHDDDVVDQDMEKIVSEVVD